MTPLRATGRTARRIARRIAHRTAHRIARRNARCTPRRTQRPIARCATRRAELDAEVAAYEAWEMRAELVISRAELVTSRAELEFQSALGAEDVLERSPVADSVKDKAGMAGQLGHICQLAEAGGRLELILALAGRPGGRMIRSLWVTLGGCFPHRWRMRAGARGPHTLRSTGSRIGDGSTCSAQKCCVVPRRLACPGCYRRLTRASGSGRTATKA